MKPVEKKNTSRYKIFEMQDGSFNVYEVGISFPALPPSFPNIFYKYRIPEPPMILIKNFLELTEAKNYINKRTIKREVET